MRIDSHKISLIEKRIDAAYRLLSSCRLCPRRCEVDRTKGEVGYCKSGLDVRISSSNLHFGEEPPISGFRGSGTVFFTGCNLGCIYCQNYPISHLRHGNDVSVAELASILLKLQQEGAHNINLVTPTHFSPQIMNALLTAYKSGLYIPIVYNCGGYEPVEMLRLWDGIIDIYMPDMKYSDPAMSKKFSGAPDYPDKNKAAVKEMYRQVGDLMIDNDGIAKKGLLIRHLVLPEDVAGSQSILKFIAEQLSKNTYISLMRQYFPAYMAISDKIINRRITEEEYNEAMKWIDFYNLKRGWIQT